ncbi:general substrate transporter [Aspergillus avenaceus]|uniref:General substrate transporter n=1 Tax=Aspergillus avenaceus TaxID=36643 RepID=A0A5N6TYF5_ASPAV|nr:general substrate transporter [Aspergillus avenaceus]
MAIEFRRYLWAIFCCGVSAVGALCYGYDQAYYTGILGMDTFKKDYGRHNAPGDAYELATSFTALTTSIIYVGELVGALLAAPINNSWGRKGVFFVASLSIIAGGIAQVADTGHEGVIILGRILIGIGIGNFTVTSLLYIGEVAPRKIRGPALMMFQFLQSCSQLVASGIDQGTSNIKHSSSSYRIPMGLLVLFPLLMLLGLLAIPESPTWYMNKNRRDDAEKALRRIHRSDPSYSPMADLAELEASVQQERKEGTVSATAAWRSLVVDPIERRKLLYSCGSLFAQQVNGIIFFYSYGVIFAQSLGLAQAFTVALITNILQVVAVGASILVGERIKRRTNLLATTFMMFFAYIIIGSIATHPVTTGPAIAIVVISYIIIVAFNFALGPLAFAYASEVAVGPNRNQIMSCSIVTFFLTTWAISFTAPYLYYDANLGAMLAFIYAGTTIITLVYIYFCFGDTTDRSVLEVAMFFRDHIPVRHWRTHTFCEQLPVDQNITKEEHFDKTRSV